MIFLKGNVKSQKFIEYSMKKLLFTGVATAIVTPFDKSGEIDFSSLGKIIKYNLDGGVSAIVVCGTTGEASTLDYEERKRVIKFTVDTIGGAVPVIAGVGSNNFASTVKMIDETSPLGVDGFLIVTPYYNKTTQDGLEKIFTEYCKRTTLPIIAYNVPSRTGIGFAPQTYEKLQTVENLIGVKEASSDISHLAHSVSLCPRLTFYSGNDDLILPALSLGARGVISVLSNILPEQTQKLCADYFKGNVQSAREIQLKYFSLIKALFCQVNPIPVKYALSRMGLCQNRLRLPLLPLCEQKMAEMDIELKKAGLI